MNNLNTIVKTASKISKNSDGKITKEKVLNIFKKKWRYDLGKYAITAKNKCIFSSEDPGYPIWYVQQTDRNGPYVSIWTVQVVRLKKEEKEIYKHICDIWKKGINNDTE